MNPKVTIYIPVYNAEKYIKRTIESCLNQTYSDFELLIVDDGSTDNGVEIIKSFNDSRIRLICCEINQGTSKASDIAIENAKGEYVARFDSDDIMRPERLAIEVDFLDNRPEIVGIGANILVHYSDGTLEYSNMPAIKDYNESLLQVQYFCPMINVTTMFRKSFIIEHNIRHNSDYIVAEDYRFFFDIIKAGGIVHNLNDVLVDHYMHGENISITRKDTLLRDDIKIRLEASRLIFEYLNLNSEVFWDTINLANMIEDENKRLHYLDNFLKLYNTLFRTYLL